MRRRPYSVVLFDEIEKGPSRGLQRAAPGAGRRPLDRRPRAVDFKNTIIIMTSNIGSQYILDVAGLDEEVEQRVREALRQHFRPEFLNRVDEIVIFHALRKEQLAAIVEIQLQRLVSPLAERQIALNLSSSAVNLLVEEGYDPAYGACPLKRVIQHKLVDAQVERADGRIRDGDEV
ncbi:MAG: AAA family ATPase [Caldilineaceae bacterium]